MFKPSTRPPVDRLEVIETKNGTLYVADYQFASGFRRITKDETAAGESVWRFVGPVRDKVNGAVKPMAVKVFIAFPY